MGTTMRRFFMFVSTERMLVLHASRKTALPCPSMFLRSLYGTGI